MDYIELHHKLRGIQEPSATREHLSGGLIWATLSNRGDLSP